MQGEQTKKAEPQFFILPMGFILPEEDDVGLEEWVAQPDGSFLRAQDELNRKPLMEASSNAQPLMEASSNALAARKGRGPRQSMADIKAAGRAKVKAAKEALAAEEATQQKAAVLWAAAFDIVFDSTLAGATARGSDFMNLNGKRVLVLVPGFSSWHSLTQSHVDRWKQAAILEGTSQSGVRPSSLVFHWPCGEVRWSAEDAQVEAAAAWQEAHEATFVAARSLTLLLKKLEALGCSVILVAHSLGARVALMALANDLAAPKIHSLILLGSAVDNHALTGRCGPPTEINGISFAEGGAVAAEFPFSRLLAKCATLTLAHAASDRALTTLWRAAEYARCGRVAPPALGSTGPTLGEEAAEGLTEEERSQVRLLNVSEDVGEAHDPTAYLLSGGVRDALFTALHPEP